MLDQILEADLDVLGGTGDSDLARHVRECTRCQAIARQIVGDTRSLATVAGARATIEELVPPSVASTRPRRRNRTTIVAAGLAALLSVVVGREWQRREVLRDKPARVATVQPRSSDAGSLVMPPATVVASLPADQHSVRLARRRETAPSDAPRPLVRAMPEVLATVAERTVVKPVDSPSAVAPVRLDTASIALGGALAVDPPTGIRANVIRTPNPTVTVVWLYQ